MSKVQTKFYKFSQNNSGGSFDINDEKGIGPIVIIEALNVDDANNRAERIGIYFNGIENGLDCSCCGSRWSEVWDDDGTDGCEINFKYDFNWYNVVYVHHLDSSIDKITHGKKGKYCA